MNRSIATLALCALAACSSSPRRLASQPADNFCEWATHSNRCSAKPAYVPAADFDANHCEFYVNSFGRGNWSHNGPSLAWIEAYLSVDTASLEQAQGGKVLGAGLYTGGASYRGFPVENEAGYYHVGMTFEGENGYARPLGDFAFFVDVRRASGKIERLWLKDGARNFNLAGVSDAYHKSYQDLGAGSVAWVEGDSPVYHQKAACRK